MCRVGRSLPPGPATTPHASSGWSRRACATIASRIALSMVNTLATLACGGCCRGVAVLTHDGRRPGYDQKMKRRTIGDLQVSAIGLGGMPMSIEGRPDTERSITTILAALDA